VWIDAVQVGDPPDLPLGSKDPDILLWADRAGRLVVSRDYKVPRHLRQHVAAGGHSPGVLLITRSADLADVIAALELIAHDGDLLAYADQYQYIP
jgi:hypothetical protein